MSYGRQLAELYSGVMGEGMTAAVKASERFTAEMRLAVYADGYVARLAGAVMADFPALQQYWGENVLRGAAEAYVKATRSKHWDLNMYPVGFAAFLRSEDVAGAVCDLAALEEAIAEVFWLADSKPLEAAMLAGLDEEAFAQLPLRLRVAGKLLALEHDAEGYVRAQRAANDAELRVGEQYVLVWRHENTVRRTLLQKEEYAMLEEFARGCSLAEAVERCGVEEEMLQHLLPSFIGRWLAEGVLAA
jgi:hypothetical protein